MLPHAPPIHVERVVLDIELIYVRDHFLDTLYARIAEFEQLVAIHANQMVMLPITEGPFVFRLISPELVPDHKITIHQQFQRVVYGRTTYPASAVFQPDVEFVGVHMIVRGVNFLENEETLRGLPATAFLEKNAEYTTNFVHLLGRNGHRAILKCTNDLTILSTVAGEMRFREDMRRL